MKMRHFLSMAVVALAFTACSDDYDDTELWNKVNDHEDRIEALETWQGQMNNNIAALQELINTTDYITTVTPVLENGEEVGYTIAFLHSDPITIYHGEKGDKGDQGEQGEQGPQGSQGEPGEDGSDGSDGSDGDTPVIGVKADGGIYYWTVNGEWLLNDNQEKMPVTGEKGDDAIAPQVRINKETNMWEISTDGGANWTSTEVEATGDSFFQNVDTSNPDYVTFTLIDGITTFNVPKYQGTMLTFALGGTELTDLTQVIDLAEGDLTYEASNGEVSVRILEGEGWSASAENGTITIKGVIGSEALLEVTLLDNGRVIETYRLVIEQTGLQGEGTATSPYTVSSAAELIYVAEQVNNSSSYYYYQKVIQLTQDIDLEGTELTIGIYKDDEKKYFYGTLDGNGHSIKGLKIDNHDQQYVGLFPILASYATVKNLTLENPSIKGTYSGSTSARVGVLAGCLNGGTIENCYVVNGTVESTEAVCGGIVGDLNSGNISNCSVEGTTIEAVSNGGGIVGFVPSTRSKPASITACYFNGMLTSDEFAGGIVGTLFNNTDYDVTVQACYASGSISGYMKSDSENNANSYIATGGIVGKLQFNCKVSACYSTASLSGKGTNGGIIGLFSTDQDSDPTVSDCYWSTSSASVPTYGIGAKGGNSAKDGGNDEGAAKVTGSDWSTAMEAMNAVLTDWQYEVNAGSDAKDFPLIIKATN